MFERNSLRLRFKGKKFYYQAEELQPLKNEKGTRYAILFPDLKKAKEFDKTSRNARMTVKNYFGSYHQIIRTGFDLRQSNLKDQNDEALYSGLLTVQEVGRKG